VQSHRFVANGLEQHVLEWSAAHASRVVVLVHGYMDAAGTWDLVAPALVSAGFRVLAPDMRGFGDGPRVPPGGYYHFADYIADLAEEIDALAEGQPIDLVGHSMGGTIATYYAGAFEGRVQRLATLEGLGPPDNSFDVAPDRMRRWIDDVRLLRARPTVQRTVGTREDAFRRLVLNHPGVSPDLLRDRMRHLVRELEDGRVAWKFDPLHKTISPTPFYARYFQAFAARVSCPVLHVGGGSTGFHPPDEDERLAAFRLLERVELEGAGHMLHWTRPDVLSDLLVRFFAGERVTTPPSIMPPASS
jgi:pimeloyl-ACP methyl ester carboxylesterase